MSLFFFVVGDLPSQLYGELFLLRMKEALAQTFISVVQVFDLVSEQSQKAF